MTASIVISYEIDADSLVLAGKAIESALTALGDGRFAVSDFFLAEAREILFRGLKLSASPAK